MNTVTVAGYAAGWTIQPQTDASGFTLYHWRAWYGPASEGNAAESAEEAQRAVDEAYARLQERVA